MINHMMISSDTDKQQHFRFGASTSEILRDILLAHPSFLFDSIILFCNNLDFSHKTLNQFGANQVGKD